MLFILQLLYVTLNAQENLCDIGDSQSPININEYLDSKYYKLELRFKDDFLIGIKNDNTSYEFTEDITKQYPEFRILGNDAKGLMVGYKPVEFRIVIPAEHQIDGEEFDVELQIWGELLGIYKNPYERVALSIMFNINETATTDYSFTLSDDQLTLNMINLADQLSTYRKYLTYRGSDQYQNEFCQENVNRFVIPHPLGITQEQFDSLVNQENTFTPPGELHDIHKRPIKRGTLTVYDQTSPHFNQIDRYISLTFIGLMFALIFALFIKEQRQKVEMAKKLKANI